MEYKEKLRLAKEALDSGSYDKETIEYIFPELAESEDEKIRKDIICMCKTLGKTKWIAWLEKQGEHAKFRDSIQVGDKVTRNQDGMLVNLSQLNRVAKKDEKQSEQPKKHDVCDYCDQQDSCVSPCPMKLVEKQGEQKPADKATYPESLDKAIDLYYFSYGNGKGSFDNLSLEKFKDIVYTFVDDYGQKSEWGEEDEAMLNLITTRLHSHPNVDLEEYSKEYDWLKNRLKSLRPQNTWKPTKMQLESLEMAAKYYMSGEISKNFTGKDLKEILEQLKKLRKE